MFDVLPGMTRRAISLYGRWLMCLAAPLASCTQLPPDPHLLRGRVAPPSPPIKSYCVQPAAGAFQAADVVLVAELNRMRADPASYADRLEASFRHRWVDDRVYLDGAGIRVRSYEGRAAVDEAVNALRAASPLPALRMVSCFNRAAGDHVRDLGPRGLMGHEGSDGSSLGDRISRHATHVTSYGEVIAYGSRDARETLCLLLVDDNVPSRHHRTLLLNPSFQTVGVATGAHSRYGTMAVMDMSNAKVEEVGDVTRPPGKGRGDEAR